MRICVVVPGLPRPGLGGGGDRISGLMAQLARRGHEIQLVAVVGKHANNQPTEEAILGFEQLGIMVHQVPYVRAENTPRGFGGLVRMFQDPEAVLAPHERMTRPSVTAQVRRIAPDCVFGFSPDALVYLQGLAEFPVLALMSETMSLNMRIQQEYGSPPVAWTNPVELLRRLKRRLEIAARERLDVRHCRTPTHLILSAPHYVDWAQRHGIRAAELFRTSTPDAGAIAWRRKIEMSRNDGPIRILVIGHLHSTNNAAGLPILFEDVLPALKKRLRNEDFTVRIVGNHHNMPAHLHKWRGSSDVEFCGPILPADNEFMNADIVLVTVPAKSGPRTRILSAFTFGACVVAHASNALGIPELQSGENCLLGANGDEIADAIMLAARDPGLRARLGEQGRRLYERLYTHEIAGASLEKLVEKTVALAAGKMPPANVKIDRAP